MWEEWQNLYQAVSIKEGLTARHAFLVLFYFSLLPSPPFLPPSHHPLDRIILVLISEIKHFCNMPEFKKSSVITW